MFTTNLRAMTCGDSLVGQLSRRYQPPPILKLVPVEQALTKTLAEFFTSNPSAEQLFRTAIYGRSRDFTNEILIVALEAIPENQRSSVVYAALLRRLEKDTIWASNFIEDIFRESLWWDSSYRLLKLSSYPYYDLLQILAAMREAGDRVFTFREGRGEFAIAESSTSGEKFFFKRVPTKREFQSVTESEFNSNFGWRSRPALKHSGRGVTLDNVQAYEQTLGDHAKLIWRYAMNSLSDESYAVALCLAERVSGLERSLDPSQVEPYAPGLRKFVESLWANARKLNFIPALNGKEYASPELPAIISQFSVSGSSMDSGDEGYIVAKFGRRTLYYVKERNLDGQLIYRKKAEPEFQALQHHRHLEFERSFQSFTRIEAITPDADPTKFPEHIISVPSDRIESLQKVLNPGFESAAGFKQPFEKYVQIVEADSATVAESGYSHKQLAEWLKAMMDFAKAGRTKVELNGRQYEILMANYRGFQTSPFGDKVSWSQDYVILDLQTGRRIRFSGGHAYMIGYYGFFEGDVEDRLPPRELIDFIEGR